MLLQKEEKKGVYECLYKSSNIIKSKYIKEDMLLEITFNYGGVYQYSDVSYKDYIRFENDESQGKVFNKYIKNHDTKKMTNVDVSHYKEVIKNIINK